MGFGDIPLFLEVPQYAELVHQHPGSIRRGIKEGRIPADKVNGRWLICRDLVFANAATAMKGVLTTTAEDVM